MTVALNPTILQIYTGGTPDPALVDIMNANRGIGRYVLIADNKYVDADKYIQTVDYVRELEADLPGVSKAWDSMTNNNKANLIRLHYLSAHENTMYLDVDVELYSIPEKLTGPAFGQWENSKIRRDVHVIYNGADTEFFKQFMLAGVRNKDLSKLPGRGVYWHLLNKKRYSRVGVIRGEHFYHLNWSRFRMGENIRGA